MQMSMLKYIDVGLGPLSREMKAAGVSRTWSSSGQLVIFSRPLQQMQKDVCHCIRRRSIEWQQYKLRGEW